MRVRKESGVKLGRPKGAGKSKLDVHKDEIMALLRIGVPKKVVARKYGTAIVNLYNWMLKNNLDVKVKETGQCKSNSGTFLYSQQ